MNEILSQDLTECKATISSLATERDELKRERDTLAVAAAATGKATATKATAAKATAPEATAAKTTAARATASRWSSETNRTTSSTSAGVARGKPPAPTPTPPLPSQPQSTVSTNTQAAVTTTSAKRFYTSPPSYSATCWQRGRNSPERKRALLPQPLLQPPPSPAAVVYPHHEECNFVVSVDDSKQKRRANRRLQRSRPAPDFYYDEFARRDPQPQVQQPLQSLMSAHTSAEHVYDTQPPPHGPGESWFTRPQLQPHPADHWPPPPPSTSTLRPQPLAPQLQERVRLAPQPRALLPQPPPEGYQPPLRPHNMPHEPPPRAFFPRARPPLPPHAMWHSPPSSWIVPNHLQRR